MKILVLTIDELDYASIWEAIAERKSFGIMPDEPDDNGEVSPSPGAEIAEICRGWLEFMAASNGRNKLKHGR